MGMKQRLMIHFVDGESRSCAEGARLAFALGHHAEVYSDIGELIAHPPREGVIIVRDDLSSGGVSEVFNLLGEAGIWIPLILASEQPDIAQVVAAIKAGAIDYLCLPPEVDNFAATLDRVAEEATAHAEARRRMVEARGRIANLSSREREVLDWLTEGSSNKVIARGLGISPRTVEIHRANMMNKLGARHAAEAVRLRLEAQLEGAPQLAMAG